MSIVHSVNLRQRTRSRLLIAGLSAAALVVCYLPTFRGMIGQWWTDEDMGHGFVVPFVMAWIIWRERPRWMALDPNPTTWGYVALAIGFLMQTASMLGAGLFAGSVALLISSIGVVLAIGGFAFVRAWTFPLTLTLFMLPKLAIVYNQITLPLQLLASRMAASILWHLGITAVREGNILTIAGRQILVAEACNGLRYLLPLSLLALVLAYITDAKVWMRIVLLAAALPIAIGANAIRVALSAAAPQLSDGAPHALCGLVIFVLCLAMLVLVRKLISLVRAYALS